MFKKGILGILLAIGGVGSASALDARLTVEIPALGVAEYHRPYIAAWVMPEGGRQVTNLALWYQLDHKREGETWLKDLRQWWRRSGRTLEMPVDGFTGASRAPGVHSIDIGHHLAPLAPGRYTLFVEASREVGGRELLSVPFAWPAGMPESLKARGESELGDVVLHLTP